MLEYYTCIVSCTCVHYPPIKTRFVFVFAFVCLFVFYAESWKCTVDAYKVSASNWR